MQLRDLADPAARRAAPWLVLQVISYIPSGPPRLALRLGGYTPGRVFWIPAPFGLGMAARARQRVAASISQATLAWACRGY
jgi:hypothetical protein